MLGRLLQVASAIVLSLGFVAHGNAVEINSVKYDIYIGDVNEDSYADLYLHGKEQFILLHGDIATPIVIPPQNSVLMPGYTGLVNLDNPGCLPPDSCYNSSQEIRQIDGLTGDAEFVIPTLTQQEIIDLGLVLLTEGDNYFVGDLNGDSISDIVLRLPEYEKAYIINGAEGTTIPAVLKEFTGDLAEEINDLTNDIEIRDGNGDGSTDVVLVPNNSHYADKAILGGDYLTTEYITDLVAAFPATLVGSSEGVFRVNESGAAVYSVPVSLPAGIAGVSPALSFDYSSQGGNSMLGYGWNLNATSTITRCRATLYQDGASKPLQLNSEDKFCIDGQRLVAVSGEYGAPGTQYKTEIDDYSFIYAMGGTNGNPDYFEVVAKDGTKKIYGNYRGSSLAMGSSTFAWALSQVEDNVGNQIEFTYLGGVENHRIDEITYAGGASHIKFYYTDSRPDIRKGFVAGEETLSSKRLDRVDVSNNGHIFRSYQLSYLKATPDNRVSRLHRIQECTEIGSSCLPALEFEWQTQRLSLPETHDHYFNPTSDEDKFLLDFKPADINGDGCQDIVFGWYDATNARFRTSYTLSENNCTSYSTVANAFSRPETSTYDSYHLEILDYNMDGHHDVALRYNEEHTWNIFLAVPGTDGQWRIDSTSQQIYSGVKGSVFIDVDSDGLVDNIDGSTAWLLKRNPNTSTTSASHYHYSSSNTKSLGAGDDPVAYGDFNGDGNVDFIRYSHAYASADAPMGVPPAWVTDTYTLSVYTQTPSGVELLSTFSSLDKQCPGSNPPECVEVDAPDLKKSVLVSDFNADGYSDILLARGDSYSLHLSTGDGFSSAISVPAKPSEIQHSSVEETLLPTVVDYNRDGLLDLVWHDRGANLLKLALWDGENKQFEGTQELRSAVDSNVYNFMDMNGDGGQDLVRISGAYSATSDKRLYLYLNQDSQSHNLITSFSNSFGNVTEVNYERMNLSDAYSRKEINGSAQHSVQPCNGANGGAYELCHSLLVSYDELNAYLYNPLDVPTSSAEFGRPIMDLNSPMPIVASVESSSPILSNLNAKAKVEYLYSEAKLQAGGRGFLGFKTLTTIDTQTGIETTTEYRQHFPYIGSPLKTTVKTAEGEILSEATNEYAENQPTGVDYKQTYLSQSIEKTYATTTDNSQADGLAVDNSEPLSITTTTFDYDSYGNLLESETIVTGEFTDPDAQSGTITLTQTKKSTHTYTGGSNITLHGRSYSYPQLGRLTRTVSEGTRNGVAQENRTVEFTYYANGMLNEEKIEPGSSDQSIKLTTKNHYDVFGNTVRVETTGWDGVVQETRLAKIEFDVSGRYANVTKNANDHIVESVIARNEFGAPTQIASANGVVSTITYDDLGREVTRFDNTATHNTVTTEYLTCATVSPGCPTGTQYAKRTSAQNGGTSVEYFDKLGRVIRAASLDFNNLWVYVATEYDILGRVERVSQPFYTSPERWSTTTYDILGRGLSTTVPASEQATATSSIVYDGATTITTNPIGQTKREIHNTFGELIKVEDNIHDTNNDYAYIRYTYDTEGNLTHTTLYPAEGGSVETEIHYDRIGRKDWMDDPDKGKWYYAYNAFGELIRQQDAKGQVVRNEYDKLGRVTKRTDFTDSNESTIENYTRWYYDGTTDSSSTTIANAIGQTTAVIMSRGAVQNACNNNAVQYCQYPSFDSYGRLVSTTTHINSDNIDSTPREVFTTSQTFDLVTGRVDKAYDALNGLVKNANGTAITSGIQNHYNSRGFLTHTTDLNNPNEELYRTVNTNVRGQVTEAEVGGYGRKMVYDEITGELTHQIAYVGGLVSLDPNQPDAFTIQHITYDWDLVGNLKSRHNRSSLRNNGSSSSNRNLQESFCYDELNRLIKTNVGTTSTGTCLALSEAQQDIRYNSIGNIVYKNNIGTYSYHATKKHAIQSTTDGRSYSYDNNGNLTLETGGRGRDIQYTTFDKPSLIKNTNNPSHESRFYYGPDRARYLQVETNSGQTDKNKTTLYLGGIERIKLSDGSYEWRRTVAGGLRTFTTDASFTMIGDEEKQYIFKDHLGSVDVIADELGNLDQSMSFDPWGARRSENSTLSVLNSTSLYQYDDSNTSRGYTGHEMLDEFGLIHMNGRIYDAALARFVQADPFVQAATDVQMFNRYSYIRNNPLNGTDPSGFISISSSFERASPVGIHKSLSKSFGFAGGSYLMMTGDIGGAYAMHRVNGRLAQNDTFAQWAPTVAGVVASVFCGPCSIGVQAMVSADITYYRTGGNYRAASKSAAMSAAYSGATYGIGQYLKANYAGTNGGFANTGLTGSGYALKIIAHATVGGIMAEVQGGKFGHGFVSAGFSAAASPFVPGADGNSDYFVQGVVISALVGGTASKLSGGKFANGASSGAIVFALNQVQSIPKNQSRQTKQKRHGYINDVFETDKNGRIIFRLKSFKSETVTNSRQSGNYWDSRKVELKGTNGKWYEAHQWTGGHDGGRYNCHGTSVGGMEFWINDIMPIVNDFFVPTNNLQVGNLVIWGNGSHSAILSTVGNNLNSSFATGLGGQQTQLSTGLVGSFNRQFGAPRAYQLR